MSVAALLRRPGPTIAAIAVAALVLIVAFEAVWRSKWGFSSPFLAAVALTAFFLTGRLVERGVYGSARASFSEGAVGGSIVLSVLYLALQAVRLPILFAPLAGVLAIAGALLGNLRPYLRARVTYGKLAIHIGFFVVVAVFASRVDRLSVTEAVPSTFAWIDTPLWLANAWGVADAFPVPDLLVHDGILDYHYGASILPVLVRALTGLPMHVAFEAVTVFYGYATMPLLYALVVRVLRPRRATREALHLAVPCVILGWFAEYIYNFPTIVAHALIVFTLMHVQRIRTWRSALFLPVVFFVLLATKEVDYLFAFIFGGVIGAYRFLDGYRLFERRDLVVRARTLVVLGVAGIATKPLYTRLVRINQKMAMHLHHDHLTASWLHREWRSQWHWWLTAAVALLLAAHLWKRRRASAFVLAGGVLTYVVGAAIYIVAEPVFDPPMDAHFTFWTLIDMSQFEQNGRHGLMLALFFVAIVSLLDDLRTKQVRVVELASVGLAAWYVHDHRWASPKPWPDPAIFDTSENIAAKERNVGGVDPVLALLTAIPRDALVMSNTRIFNGETPHWSAYYGHHFYLLRTGRWAGAQPRFAEMRQIEERVYAAPSAAEALSLMKSEHVTHVLVDKQHSPAWAAELRPLVENDVYAVYAVP